jgi:hypothetical protein
MTENIWAVNASQRGRRRGASLACAASAGGGSWLASSTQTNGPSYSRGHGSPVGRVLPRLTEAGVVPVTLVARLRVRLDT